MPTAQWKKERHLFTFWVMKEEAAAFQAACLAAGKSQTDVLRDAVLLMLGRDGARHA